MAAYLNNGLGDPVREMIKRSWDLLEKHPLNLKRKERGCNPANSIWLWGQGKAPRMPSFQDVYGLRGGVISAVDLLKGIGVSAGLIPITVPGATGYIDTNYIGKAEAALDNLKDLDFIFLHVEAPDEAGHAGDPREKIRAIEYFDEQVVGTVLEGARVFDDFSVMVVSDHLTPVSKRTHTGEPTLFAWAGKESLLGLKAQTGDFSEKAAEASGLFFQTGQSLLQAFIKEG
jgi:2,3-bisphosphoglycerate-independent phosphoglycerate mutase